MARYIARSSGGTMAIGVCARCGFKVHYSELSSDPNNPGLRVCTRRGCKDEYDPYRLAPRPTEIFTLRHPRPDIPLSPPNRFRITQDGGIRIIDTGQIRKPT